MGGMRKGRMAGRSALAIVVVSVISLVALALLAGGCGSGGGQERDSDGARRKDGNGLVSLVWPTPYQNPGRVGRGSAAGPRSSEPKWIVDTGIETAAWTVLTKDGDLVAGFKGKVACFDAASGAVAWEFSTGGDSATTCGVDSDGTVYVSAGSKVYALSPEGKQRWSYDLGATADDPCVGVDAVYIGSAGGKLVALDKQGGLKWETTVSGYIRSPSLDREGNLYCAASPFTLYAFDASGKKLWEAKPEGHLPPGEALYEWANTLDTPSIGADGTIYAGSMPGPLKGEGGIPVSPGAAGKGKLYAFSPDGRLKWSYAYGGTTPSDYLLIHSPSIARDGTLYCGTNIWRVLAISPEGKLVWEYNTGEGSDVCPSVYSPSIDAEGMLYAATTSGKMICINAQGQEQWRYDSGMPWLPSRNSNNMTPPPIGADGTLFSVMASGKLLAW